jgi:antitoxin component of RelBE/YafQ-DinJ toxin-antitoxin module
MKWVREQINLRISDVLKEKIKKLARELGVSRNSAILILIEDGFIARKNGFIPPKEN